MDDSHNQEDGHNTTTMVLHNVFKDKNKISNSPKFSKDENFSLAQFGSTIEDFSPVSHPATTRGKGTSIFGANMDSPDDK